MLRERRRPCSIAAHDRGEVVVEQHEIGGLTSDIGAGLPHRDADVGACNAGPSLTRRQSWHHVPPPRSAAAMRSLCSGDTWRRRPVAVDQGPSSARRREVSTAPGSSPRPAARPRGRSADAVGVITGDHGDRMPAWRQAASAAAAWAEAGPRARRVRADAEIPCFCVIDVEGMPSTGTSRDHEHAQPSSPAISCSDYGRARRNQAAREHRLVAPLTITVPSLTTDIRGDRRTSNGESDAVSVVRSRSSSMATPMRRAKAYERRLHGVAPRDPRPLHLDTLGRTRQSDRGAGQAPSHKRPRTRAVCNQPRPPGCSPRPVTTVESPKAIHRLEDHHLVAGERS